MTSIIITTYNQQKLLAQCLSSLFVNTGGKFEVIIIDNASTDGTKEYLQTVEKERGNVRVLYNKENLGFVKANNQGILLARGEYICLLNNDTVLTKDWLLKLKRVLERDPRVGLVGPYSNFASGPQCVQVNARNQKEIMDFINNFRMPERPIDRLVFFCVLIRAELFNKNKCGLLDAAFHPGNFEDDFFCWTAKRLGYQMRVVNCFIWHVGSQSFRKDPRAFMRLLGRNQKTFYRKTGREIKISLCMIVGDYEKPETLKRCLDTIAPFVDEICINLTYRHLARKTKVWDYGNWIFPAKYGFLFDVDDEFILNYPMGRTSYEKWKSDFAYHRNQANKLATGNWIVYMDCADTYESGLLLRKCIVENDSIADYQTANVFAPSEDGVNTRLLHVRAWRNHKGYEWRKPIHEDILLSIKEKQGRAVTTDLCFTHHGYKAKGSTYAKNHRNLKIMKRHVENNPNADSLDLYHLANTYILLGTEARKDKSWIASKKSQGYLRKALGAIDRCLNLPLLETDPLWPKMVFQKARIHHEGFNDFEEAKKWYNLTIEKQDYIESLLGMAEILVAEKKFKDALALLLKMFNMGLGGQIKVTSIPKNMEEMEWGMWYNMGLCYFNLENYKMAKQSFQKALLIYKNYTPAIHLLTECLNREGNWQLGFNLNLQAINIMPRYANGYFALGIYEFQHRRYASARLFFQEVIRLNPHNEIARKNLMECEKWVYKK